MKFFYQSLIFLLFLTACTQAKTSLDPVQAEEHYQRGIQFAQKSLLQNALKEFDLAIQFNPEHYNAYRKKGLILFGLRQYDQAKQMFLFVMQKEPGNVQALINLGMTNYVLGLKTESKEQWQQAISLHADDNDSKALNNLANLYKEEKNYSEAIQFYEKALLHEPGSALFAANLGDSYRLDGNYGKAEEWLKKSIALEPEAMLSHFQLGIFYQEQEKIDPAISAFRRSLEINPAYVNAAFHLGELHWAMNDKPSAKKWLQQALAANPKDPRYLALASTMDVS
jgi:superkiller protein 3